MPITAKFAGQCRKCGSTIRAGEQIEWERGNGARHLECPKREPVPDDAIRISGGSGNGCRGWKVGQVVRHRGEHEFVYVLAAKSRYIAEDGLSFGVGDEQGHTYSATCRPATDEESAPIRAEIALLVAKRAATEELRAIAKQIQTDGEMPTGDNSPEGDRVADTQTIYGGGDWFVVGPEWIWYCRNNGADGDDWTHNNIITGGAGALGYRVVRTDALVARITAASE